MKKTNSRKPSFLKRLFKGLGLAALTGILSWLAYYIFLSDDPEDLEENLAE